jgi:glyoxylase-like metal-dependent hydrolase (beta-lactamase superfamily II)
MIATTTLKRAGIGAFLAACALLAPIAAPVSAAAPMANIQAPGFYRMTLGDFEVTALNDGTASLPVNKILKNTTPAEVDAALAKYHQSSPLETSFNAYLVNTGTKLVLIDTGNGMAGPPGTNKMLANLKASGYQPEQVDEIYITHFHGDHIGGLVDNDGKILFPNATVRADKHESDFWVSEDNMNKAPDDYKGSYKKAIAMLTPYIKAGKYKPFDGATELVPVIHVAAVQMDNPSVVIGFDTDIKAAETERRKLFTEAAEKGWLVGGAHLSFPGVGYLHENGKGYLWQPVNYAQLHS